MKHLVDRKMTPEPKLILAQLVGPAIKCSTSGNLVKCSTIGKGSHEGVMIQIFERDPGEV